jgi:hypothetical protein
MSEVIQNVRILPMSSDFAKEFPDCKTIEDVQQKYFLEELPRRENCSYLIHKKGLKNKEGVLSPTPRNLQGVFSIILVA